VSCKPFFQYSINHHRDLISVIARVVAVPALRKQQPNERRSFPSVEIEVCLKLNVDWPFTHITCGGTNLQ